MGTYNGHPSRNYWNVSLWINNDEGLYRLALDCIRQQRRNGRRAAAEMMLEALSNPTDHDGHPCVPTTPDGSPYTAASIQHAMRGMER